MKRIVRLTESDLVKLVKKVLKEQSDPLEGWDKLKEGQKIVLKSDIDGKITSWIVDGTSPNPGRSGKGTKLFLYPDGAESRKITNGAIEVSFFPKEMKVDMFNGMNSIVKDAIVPPKKPISSIPSKPTFVKGKLPKDLKNFIIIKAGKEPITAVKPDLEIEQNNFGKPNQHGFAMPMFVARGKTWDGLNIEIFFGCEEIVSVRIDGELIKTGLPRPFGPFNSSNGFENSTRYCGEG
jgi:hypothetical protein